VLAWLVTDEHAELRAALRRLAGARGMPSPAVAEYSTGSLSVRPFPVEHTPNAVYGYRISAGCRIAGWAPEFWRFPDWADGAGLMFAEAAAWDRPIRFRGGVGGHASVAQVAAEAARRGVRRLVYAHIGRPSLRAMDAGLQPLFGEWGAEGRTYTVAGQPCADLVVSAAQRVTRLALPGCAGVHGAGGGAENAPQDTAGGAWGASPGRQQDAGGDKRRLCRQPGPEPGDSGIASPSDDFGAVLVVGFQERRLSGVTGAGRTKGSTSRPVCGVA
jgi:hypothetical protein